MAVTLVVMAAVVGAAETAEMTVFCGRLLESCGGTTGDSDEHSTGESTVTSAFWSIVTGDVGVTVDPTSLFGPGRGTNDADGAANCKHKHC